MQNILRVETTINNPDQFNVSRHKQDQKPKEKKSRLPLRKGVMDIPLRAKVFGEVNDRMMNDRSCFQDEKPVKDFVEKMSCHRL